MAAENVTFLVFSYVTCYNTSDFFMQRKYLMELNVRILYIPEVINCSLGSDKTEANSSNSLSISSTVHRAARGAMFPGK